jgi:3-hydroxybutyryl-CoA dehydrogenase
MATIAANLDRMISKGVITEEDKAKTITNIITYTDIKDGVVGVDLVVEATENIDLKLSIFKQLSEASPDTISTNTSSISITQIGRWFQINVIGMHFESGTYHEIRNHPRVHDGLKTIDLMGKQEKLSVW